jgi:hypothetical protein
LDTICWWHKLHASTEQLKEFMVSMQGLLLGQQCGREKLMYRNKLFEWVFVPLRFNVSVGGSSGSQDTSMSRVGTSTTKALKSHLGQLQNASTVGRQALDRANASANDRVANMLLRTRGVDAIGSVNPYSSSYISDTEDLVDYEVSRALAIARTGESNVLSPVVRGQSFREADALIQSLLQRAEVIKNFQLSTAQNSAGAVNAYANLTNGAVGNSVGAASAGASMVAAHGDTFTNLDGISNDNVNGKGAQTSSSVSAGGACCWIFLEAYHGKMPWWVRECRNELAGESSDRRKGYRLMAELLVPSMRRSAFVREAVWQNIVLPITKFGGAYKGVKGFEEYGSLQQVTEYWFKVWEQLGKEYKL